MATKKKPAKKAVKKPIKKAKTVDGRVTRRKAAKDVAKVPVEQTEPEPVELDGEALLDEDDFFADVEDDVIDPLDEGEDSTPEPGEDGL